MYEVLTEVINRLEVEQLKEIFVLNKLKLQGFRISGPSTPIKTKRMKISLINNSDLEMIFRKTADIYQNQRNKDFSWALVSNVNKDLIKKKLEETNIAEVTYGLIKADKLNLLESILLDSNKTADSFESEQIKLTTDNKKYINASDLNSRVIELNEIINILKVKNKSLTLNIKKLEQDLSKTKQENKNLNKKMEKNRHKNKEENEVYLRNKEILNLTKERLANSEENNKELLLENDLLKINLLNLGKLRFLFYGTKYYRKFIEIKTTEIHNLQFDYIDNLQLVPNYKQYQKLIVLMFTLNKTEALELNDKEIIKHFEKLYNLVIISSLDQLNEYMTKVGASE